jgi:hypothetical protein
MALSGDEWARGLTLKKPVCGHAVDTNRLYACLYRLTH